MSVIEKGMNFPLCAGSGRFEFSFAPRDFLIVYELPYGVSPHHFRIMLRAMNYYAYGNSYAYCGYIAGRMRQYTSNGSLLREDTFYIPYGGSATIEASSGVAYIEVTPTYMELNMYCDNIQADRVLDGSGSEIIRIACENAGNEELSALSIKSVKVITGYKTFERLTISSETPKRSLTIYAPNTSNYIKRWVISIHYIEGSPNPADKLWGIWYDNAGNLLYKDWCPVASGVSVSYPHSPDIARMEIVLEATAKVRVNVRVFEYIDIAHGVGG